MSCQKLAKIDLNHFSCNIWKCKIIFADLYVKLQFNFRFYILYYFFYNEYELLNMYVNKQKVKL